MENAQQIPSLQIPSLQLPSQQLPSSLPGGRPNPGSVIVCVDIPDPDNFLMVLRVLLDHQEQHVYILISPRPVSFAAIPYGDNMKLLQEKCKEKNINSSRVLGRITQEDLDTWVRKLGPNEQNWLFIDEDFSDPQVRKDTELYLEVSRARLITFLDQHNIPHQNYSLYTDRDLETCGIVPGTHHSLHRADFSFDFEDMLLKKGLWDSEIIPRLTEDQLKRYNKMHDAAVDKKTRSEAKAPATNGLSHSQGMTLKSIYLFQAAVKGEPDYLDKSQRSEQRRDDTRLLCEIYSRKKPGHQAYGSIEELTNKLKNKKGATKPLIYVGGPFTEALKIVEGLGHDNIGPIIAMAGATHGQNNIFSNQFNILIDPSSAKETFKMARENKIDLTLLPTECVKGSAYDLTWDTFKNEVAPKCNHIDDLYTQWSPNRPVTLFDLLAAMAVTTDLYHGMLKPVIYTVQDGRFKFDKVEGKEASEGPGLKMFWNEPSPNGKFDENPHMKDRKELFLKEVLWTLKKCKKEDTTRLNRSVDELKKAMG